MCALCMFFGVPTNDSVYYAVEAEACLLSAFTYIYVQSTVGGGGGVFCIYTQHYVLCVVVNCNVYLGGIYRFG